MVRKVHFGASMRADIKKGVDILADAVKATLGPCGRNVIYEKSFTTPSVTKDGVTVAKEIILEDKLQDMGAQMVKEVASKTAEIAGDGTTTATVLAQAIYNEGYAHLTSGVNPVSLKREIDKAVDSVIAEIKSHVRPVTTKTEIKQVATLSANSDSDIGTLIADAMDKVGKEGVITIEESRTGSDELEVVEGIRIDRGFISHYFITNIEKSLVEMVDPLILIHDQKITQLAPLVPLLTAISKASRPLVIIADDMDQEALAPLIVNKMQNRLQVVVIKAPSFGNQRKALLEDLAIFTGGTFIDTDANFKLEDIEETHLGTCKRLIISKDETTIIKGGGSQEAINDKLAQLRVQIANTTSEYDRDKYKERLASLNGGVAVIRVGGVTEAEMKERKDRVDDALSATRAAIEEGIVIGGGTAYVKAVEKVLSNRHIGSDIVRKALRAPLYVIAQNGGYSGEVVYNDVVKSSSYDMGFDARNGRIVNMFDSGIIDPFKVTRCALQHAASIAGLLLTTEVAIFKKEDKPEKPLMTPVPGGMY